MVASSAPWNESCAWSRPASTSPAQSVSLDPDARGDEVRVEPAQRRVPRQFDDVAPRRRLAAREVDVQRAERGGFAEDALPRLGVEFGRRAVPAPAGSSSAGSRAGSDGSARRGRRSAARARWNMRSCLEHPLGLEVAEHGGDVLLDHRRRRVVARRRARRRLRRDRARRRRAAARARPWRRSRRSAPARATSSAARTSSRRSLTPRGRRGLAVGCMGVIPAGRRRAESRRRHRRDAARRAAPTGRRS